MGIIVRAADISPAVPPAFPFGIAAALNTGVFLTLEISYTPFVHSFIHLFIHFHSLTSIVDQTQVLTRGRPFALSLTQPRNRL